MPRSRAASFTPKMIAQAVCFPTDSLPDHTATVRTLSELQGRGPAMLAPRR
jgi:hypothetical protein